MKEKKMIIRALLSLTLVISCFLQLQAKEKVNSIWGKANKYYTNQKYDSAAVLYEQLAKDNIPSFSLYYNLGNTYFRLHQYPKAILNYEKSLKLDPHNQNALDNIHLSQTKLENPLANIDPVFFLGWWSNFVSFFPPWIWGFLALFLFFSILFFFFCQYTGRYKISYFDRWAAAIIGLFLFSFLLFYLSYQDTKIEKAVVMSTQVPVYQELNSSKTDIYAPAGTVLKITKRQENFVFVELPNGAKGWVNHQSIAEVKI